MFFHLHKIYAGGKCGVAIFLAVPESLTPERMVDIIRIENWGPVIPLAELI